MLADMIIIIILLNIISYSVHIKCNNKKNCRKCPYKENCAIDKI